VLEIADSIGLSRPGYVGKPVSSKNCQNWCCADLKMPSSVQLVCRKRNLFVAEGNFFVAKGNVLQMIEISSEE
jgi:hypothetical protein